ncbi:MAG: DUF456 domain-containing protein [Candidatus Omnitrophica bacterium]|nr:DUF456 domain-containing protein [Candidatus Omnitrophota bacterium]
MIEIIALTLLVLSSVAGFICIFFTNFGTLIIFLGSILYALATRFSVIGIQTLAILLVCYVIGEIIEYAGVIIGAKKFGASSRAIVGALIGGFIGGFLGVFLLGIGIFLGTFLGIFCGAFLTELIVHRDWRRSLKSGAGGVVGRLIAISGKVVIALFMLFFIANSLIFYSPVFNNGQAPLKHHHEHHEQ